MSVRDMKLHSRWTVVTTLLLLALNQAGVDESIRPPVGVELRLVSAVRECLGDRIPQVNLLVPIISANEAAI